MHTIREDYFLHGWATVADLSRNEDSAVKGGMGRVTCPRLLPPMVAQHCSLHLPALLPTGQATSAPSCPVLVLVSHTKAPVLMAVHLPQPWGAAAHECRRWHEARAVHLFSPYGHGTTGARGCKHSLAAPKSRGDTRGAIGPHHLLHYPQYPIRICQQMALIICLTCPQPRYTLSKAQWTKMGHTLSLRVSWAIAFHLFISRQGL